MPLYYKSVVRPRGIEPLSTVLQTVAMTTSAKDANDTLLITLYAECHGDYWYLVTGSNRRPSPCKGDTLPLS